MRRERGIGLFKLLFWAAVLSVGVAYAAALIPPYYTYWKVQDMFEGIARNLSDLTATEIERKLPELMDVKYISRSELPEEFWENLSIEADGERVRIKSHYHVVVWPLGPVQGADPEDYDPEELQGLDKLRDKLRIDLEFSPHAETP